MNNKKSNKLWLGILGGAVAGIAISLLDKNTRNSVMTGSKNMMTNIKGMAKNPDDLVGSVKDMSGPVGIVSVIAQTGSASQTASLAARNISYLAAFIAVNLAVMNLLPIPALDGGRVFFLVIMSLLERILGRKIDPKYEGYIHGAGMILLLGFIAYVSFRDVWKLIAGV